MADRTGKFVLLTYSLTTSHQTAVHCCSTEAHLAAVPFLCSFDSHLVKSLPFDVDARRCSDSVS